MNEFKNLSLDELREHVSRIKAEVDSLNDLLYRQYFYERNKEEIRRASEQKFTTARFHD
jgi:GGDEF domain-containing protein